MYNFDCILKKEKTIHFLAKRVLFLSKKINFILIYLNFFEIKYNDNEINELKINNFIFEHNFFEQTDRPRWESLSPFANHRLQVGNVKDESQLCSGCSGKNFSLSQNWKLPNTWKTNYSALTSSIIHWQSFSDKLKFDSDYLVINCY